MKPQYTDFDLNSALEAVAGGQSLRKAALEWGIPRSTLRNRVHGHESRQEGAQDLQRLSPVQEEHLASWVLNQEALGLPLTHAQIREFASRILAIRGDTKLLGKSWLRGFLRRHREIGTKRTRLIDSRRTNGANAKVITAWFKLLALPIIQGIKPANRYNMDEAGIMEGMGSNGLVLGRAGTQAIQQKTPGSKAWTSFIECVSAIGSALPPLVIFKGKTVQQQWFPPDLKPFAGWKFTATENGWTSDETAFEWLQTVFLPLTQPEDVKETRLLIFDGHGSHQTVDFMWECYKHNVHLIYLPPHASHVLQPLDLSIFSPLKQAYRRYIGYLTYLTDSSPIGKQNFLECYRRARCNAITPSNIKAGWAVTGLWPVRLSKPLASPLLLENSNAGKEASIKPQDNSPPAKAPFSLPLRVRGPLGPMLTPRRAEDLKRALNTMEKDHDINIRTSRLLKRKITKGFDEKDYRVAMLEEENKALKARLEALRPKKRKKVELSPNSKFADIEAIRRAQIKAGAVEESLIEGEQESDEDSEASTAEGSCIVVAVR